MPLVFQPPLCDDLMALALGGYAASASRHELCPTL